MKTICKSLFTHCLTGVLSLAVMATSFAPTAWAQAAPEPAVVISIAPVKEQMNDINYLVDTSGFGQAKFLIKSQIRYVTGGIDTKRPAGALLYFKGDNPVPTTVAFLPVKDLDDLLDTVSNMAEVDDEDDVIKIIPPNGETLYAVEQGTHVFITTDEEALADLPKDPVAMLGDLPSKYNVGVHLYGDRIPEELRAKAIEMIKEGYVDSLENLDTDPAKIDAQIADFEEQIGILEDVDEIVFGMLADEESHKLAMEFAITGKPGSKIDKSYAGFADSAPTRFAGFMNDKSAADYSFAFNINPEDSEKVGAQLDTLIETMMTELDNDGEFDEQELDSIRSAAVQISEVIEETIKEGRADSAGQLLMDDNRLDLVAAGQISDPAKIESAVKELVELLKDRDEDKVLDFNLDFAKFNGVNLHEIIINVPEDEEEARDVLGSEVAVILGIGKKEVYLAAGKSPLETLKQAMAMKGAAPEYPVIYNLRVTPFLKFAAKTTGQPMFDNLVERLTEVGRDKMTIYSKAIDHGLFTRMEMEDGPIELIQEAVEGVGGADF